MSLRETHTHTHSVIGEKETDTSEDCRQINLNISISGRTNKNYMKINVFWLTYSVHNTNYHEVCLGTPPKNAIIIKLFSFSFGIIFIMKSTLLENWWYLIAIVICKLSGYTKQK